MKTNEGETVARLSSYLTQQLKLCIVATVNKAEADTPNSLYWAGAKSSSEALLELVTEDNLNEALIESILSEI